MFELVHSYITYASRIDEWVAQVVLTSAARMHIGFCISGKLALFMHISSKWALLTDQSMLRSLLERRVFLYSPIPIEKRINYYIVKQSVCIINSLQTFFYLHWLIRVIGGQDADKIAILLCSYQISC
jgi:hypothetical protein